MSFHSDLRTSNELCDRCKKRFTPADPGIEFYAKNRGETANIIWLHLDCLRKLIAKALRELGAPPERIVTVRQPSGGQIEHLNGDPRDNRIENLAVRP